MERLCFHKRLSFYPQGGVVHPPGKTPPQADTLSMQTPPLPADTAPGRHPLSRQPLGQTHLPPGQTAPPQPHSPRRPLKRTVRILLESILVLI